MAGETTMIGAEAELVDGDSGALPPGQAGKDADEVVKPVSFSVIELEEALAAGSLLPQQVLKRFHEPNLVSRTRYVESAGIPGGEKKIARLLDGFLRIDPTWHRQWFTDPIFVSNLSYFAPTAFSVALRAGWVDLGSIYAAEARTMAASPDAVQVLLDGLKQEWISVVSAPLALQLSLACAALRDDVQAELEDLRMILSVRQRESESRSLVQSVLERRVKELTTRNLSEDRRKERGNRCALMVSGQLRGFEEGLAQLSQYLDLDSLKIDVYVSSWVMVGAASINRARLSRRFTSDAARFLDENYSDEELEDLQRWLPSHELDGDDHSLRERIISLFPWAEEIRVNLDDERRYPYRSYGNPAKMYYHNAYWIETLGRSHFTENYDYIIKMRPDLKVRPGGRIDQAVLAQLVGVAADTNSFIYEPWGFGMGDQLFYGVTADMVELLSFPISDASSSRLMVLAEGRPTGRMGHINLALEWWLRGGRIEASVLQRGGFFEAPRMTLESLQQHISQHEGGLV